MSIKINTQQVGWKDVSNFVESRKGNWEQPTPDKDIIVVYSGNHLTLATWEYVFSIFKNVYLFLFRCHKLIEKQPEWQYRKYKVLVAPPTEVMDINFLEALFEVANAPNKMHEAVKKQV